MVRVHDRNEMTSAPVKIVTYKSIATTFLLWIYYIKYAKQHSFRLKKRILLF